MRSNPYIQNNFIFSSLRAKRSVSEFLRGGANEVVFCKSKKCVASAKRTKQNPQPKFMDCHTRATHSLAMTDKTANALHCHTERSEVSQIQRDISPTAQYDNTDTHFHNDKTKIHKFKTTFHKFHSNLHSYFYAFKTKFNAFHTSYPSFRSVFTDKKFYFTRRTLCLNRNL